MAQPLLVLDCDGMTYDEIAEKMPEEFQQRAANKLVRT
jgi:hypothetical protein